MWIQPKINWSGNPGEYFNIEDWNRVENNTRYLADFYGLSLFTRTWTYSMIPDITRINHIKNNINQLCHIAKISSLRVNDSLQQIFDYQSMNEIESKLIEIYKVSLIDGFSLKHAGAFSCGQPIYIPGVMI